VRPTADFFSGNSNSIISVINNYRLIILFGYQLTLSRLNQFDLILLAGIWAVSVSSPRPSLQTNKFESHPRTLSPEVILARDATFFWRCEQD
jgi:hypothetical protein